MGKLKFIVIHCTATYPDQQVAKSDIERWHLKERGWSRLGYSELIDLDGKLVNLTPYDYDDEVDYNEMTWGVKGINGVSRHIVYAGGLNRNGEPEDTRNEKQRWTMFWYLKKVIELHPDILIAGHNDFASKACPCFSVADWLSDTGFPQKNIYLKGKEKLEKEPMNIHAVKSSTKFATINREEN